MANEAKIAELNQRFAIPDVAQIAAGKGGLPRIEIETATASAEIYLHGAQVTGWRPAGTSEVLFLSEKSHWEAGRAIRGGIPVCFPWFRAKRDNPKAPTHGFVRTKEWNLESIRQEKDGSVCALLSTASDEATRLWWPFDFRLEHRITVGTQLKLELTMKNSGRSGLQFEEALHTYFRVRDVEQARVRGLDGIAYLDNLDGNRRKVQAGELQISAQTDDAFVDASGPVEIEDQALRRRLRTSKWTSHSTIVWNPWRDGASSLEDLGPEEWRQMLCVEGGNILSSAVQLEPETSHVLTVEISVADESAYSFKVDLA
jgi:glucose-6-phosphate 1-epimerase